MDGHRSSGLHPARFVAERLEPRLILSASPIGPEFRVNSLAVPIHAAAVAAMDGDRDFVIAWNSFNEDAPNAFGIYARRYNALGGALGSQFLVNTTTASDQAAPVVAMDATGDFIIAWQSRDQDGSGYGIYAQRFGAVGNR